MKTIRAIAFMLSVATLSSVSLSSANALAKVPLLDSFEVPEAALLQPTSQPASLEQESVPHKMTIAQAGPSFPLIGSTPRTKVEHKFYMTTDINISNTGIIYGVTKAENARDIAISGFVGVVEVILTDKDGNILYITGQQRVTVPGLGKKEVVKSWQANIPADVPLDKITGYVIYQRNSPPKDILKTLGGILKAAQAIAGIIKVF